MMTGRGQEYATSLLALAIAALVFWQTRGQGVISGGQISPGGFPRAAAGLMAIFAGSRIVLLTMGAVRIRADEQLDLRPGTLARPALTVAAMSAYVYLFGSVPLFPLTLAFVAVVFLIFGVRPWQTLVFRALLVSGGLFILFRYLLKIAE